jgi:hypothetical protein
MKKEWAPISCRTEVAHGSWTVQDITKHGVVVRVYTPPGKADVSMQSCTSASFRPSVKPDSPCLLPPVCVWQDGRFALRAARDTLDLYDDFFAVPYPLPKLDMVAIPEFAMGAMENWGCVTYREVGQHADQPLRLACLLMTRHARRRLLPSVPSPWFKRILLVRPFRWMCWWTRRRRRLSRSSVCVRWWPTSSPTNGTSLHRSRSMSPYRGLVSSFH